MIQKNPIVFLLPALVAAVFFLCGTGSAAVDPCAGKTGAQLQACRQQFSANNMTADAMMSQQQQLQQQAATNAMQRKINAQSQASVSAQNQMAAAIKKMKR